MIMKEICVSDRQGNKFWYLNGELHREDGPAIERANGTKYWYINDKLHREDGPAMEYADGTKVWYLNSVRMTEESYLKCLENKDQENLLNLNRFDNSRIQYMINGCGCSLAEYTRYLEHIENQKHRR